MPSIGLSPGRSNGWRYPFALTFLSQDLHSANGGGFASVRTRAILGGIGYGWHFARPSTGVQTQTGYAFNHATLDGDVEHAFNVPNGTVSIHIDNSWLLRPEIKASSRTNSRSECQVTTCTCDRALSSPLLTSALSGSGTKVTFTQISGSGSTHFESHEYGSRAGSSARATADRIALRRRCRVPYKADSVKVTM